MTRVNVAGFCLAEDMLRLRGDSAYNLVLAGLHAAASILDLVAPLEWEALPIHTLRSVLYAGVFAAHLKKMRMHLSATIDPTRLLERAVDILRHLAYGNDFPTRAKIVLETELKRRDSAVQPNGQWHSSFGDEHGREGITFSSRMEANMYWDLVESEKGEHNWNQNADDIYRELLTSGTYLFNQAH